MQPIATEIVAFVLGAALSALWVRRPVPSRQAVVPSPPPAVEPVPDYRFDHLIASLPLAAVVVDRSGRVASFNAVAQRDFNLDPLRSPGRALIEAIPSVDIEQQVTNALAGVSSTRSVTVTALDRERTFTIAAFPVSDDGAALVADEVTQTIALERVRRDFISNVSHELRTPLSAIKLMVETVLLSEGDAEAVKMFLPKVGHEVDRMVQLIEDLLALARSESGRLPLRLETFDLAEFAASVVQGFEQRAATLEVTLEVRARSHVAVDADRNRLTQVLVNLVDNALRHTLAGGSIIVTVDRDGSDAVLAVRDTGTGIPYNDLPHIFERFYVVERSRARERSGTGLGLSIAKQLMEAHGGSIVAESDLGTGSTFRCRLPARSPAPLTAR